MLAECLHCFYVLLLTAVVLVNKIHQCQDRLFHNEDHEADSSGITISEQNPSGVKTVYFTMKIMKLIPSKPAAQLFSDVKLTT